MTTSTVSTTSRRQQIYLAAAFTLFCAAAIAIYASVTSLEDETAPAAAIAPSVSEQPLDNTAQPAPAAQAAPTQTTNLSLGEVAKDTNWRLNSADALRDSIAEGDSDTSSGKSTLSD